VGFGSRVGANAYDVAMKLLPVGRHVTLYFRDSVDLQLHKDVDDLWDQSFNAVRRPVEFSVWDDVLDEMEELLS
jgi:hypothetical protein